MRVCSVVVAAVVACLVVAGCSTPKAGVASPVTSTSSSSSGLPAHGAPKVDNPLNAEKYLQTPCSTMTAEQARDVAGFTTAEPDLNGGTGPECVWRDSARNSISVAFVVAGGGGLTGVYESLQGNAAYFTPVQVAGYPGVFADAIDYRARGRCSLSIGVRDNLLLSVIAGFDSESPNYGDSCPAVQKMAEFAVETMKAGA